MADTPIQIARQEMAALARSLGAWIGLAATGFILGLAGPFGTDEVLRTVPRIVYWIAVVAIGFFAGSAVATVVAETLRARRIGLWPAVIVAGACAGVVNFILLMVVNAAIFGIVFLELQPLLILGGNVVAISIVISAAYVAIERQVTGAAPGQMKGPGPGQEAPAPPRLLDRLPVEKRGRLVAISVQDHYVEVATTKGAELILMRLGDAMGETGAVKGMQVHRSHWVATGEVTAARRDGARAILTMSDGRDIPVSRTYVPAVKEAGLLP